jgi:hypothetical protein
VSINGAIFLGLSVLASSRRVDVWWAIGNYYLSGCIAVDSIPCRTSLFRQYAPCLPPLVFSLNFVIPFLFYSAFFVCRLFSGRQRAAAGGSGSGGRLSGGGGRFGGGGGDGGGRGGHRRRSARRPAAARAGSGRAFRDGCAHVGDVGDMRVGERDVADQGARDAILLAQPPVLRKVRVHLCGGWRGAVRSSSSSYYTSRN